MKQNFLKIYQVHFAVILKRKHIQWTNGYANAALNTKSIFVREIFFIFFETHDIDANFTIAGTLPTDDTFFIAGGL